MNVEGLALERNVGLRSWLVLGLMTGGKAEQGPQTVFGRQGCPEAPELDALFRRIGILAEQVPDDVAESGAALRGIARAGAVRVLPESDIQDPVELVLDAPMGADTLPDDLPTVQARVNSSQRRDPSGISAWDCGLGIPRIWFRLCRSKSRSSMRSNAPMGGRLPRERRMWTASS